MGVVQLEHYFFIEFSDVIVLLFILFNRPLYAGGNKEILLLQAQFLACVVVVVGVKDLHNGFGQVLLLHCLLVVSPVKGIQIKGVDGFCVPDTQGIHHIVAVSDDRQVIGHRADRLVSVLYEMVHSALVLNAHIAAEFNLGRILRPADLKGVAVL